MKFIHDYNIYNTNFEFGSYWHVSFTVKNLKFLLFRLHICAAWNEGM